MSEGSVEGKSEDEREGWNGRGDGVRGRGIGDGGMGGVVKSDL